MTTTLAVLLLVSGVWNFVVWPAFFRRVMRDPRSRDASGRPTRFLIVHTVLIGISLLIGALSIVFGLVGLFS
ncbi:SCO4848 family membrane protein [Naasia sp. SYSU D00057]|uniref:SCO4848 family membrane protein n=1 Tax=Naasia sp. SYSU D00057 TaxID=2817380 RepID=UPI001B3176B6|nr:hypothetical protein [Naasia sp. SYSU D00057]